MTAATPPIAQQHERTSATSRWRMVDGEWPPSAAQVDWVTPGAREAPGATASAPPFTNPGPAGRANAEAIGLERGISRRTFAGALVAVALVTGAGGAAGGAAAAIKLARPVPGAPAASAAPAAGTHALTTTAGTGPAALYRQVAPAVVGVQTAGARGGGGEGSGFIVDAQGHVITNNHVVAGASRVTLHLLDGTSVPAQVVVTDPANDLAVLKAAIPPDKSVAARLGDSDAVQPGEPAVAIGNPFGFEHSITAGIVSAVDRQFGGSRSRRPIPGLIQTDTAVNPGNSGGPLLNAAGEVIGVNTLGVSPVPGSVGVSFAVPINAAKRLLAQVTRVPGAGARVSQKR
ncbi:MAG: trypsin-like peptidase domain-containing protein [Chloroflexi bacterium]|nr:trypsin-like peptidase domain-containing protein [Chloroflexota bacterium]